MFYFQYLKSAISCDQLFGGSNRFYDAVYRHGQCVLITWDSQTVVT